MHTLGSLTTKIVKTPKLTEHCWLTLCISLLLPQCITDHVTNCRSPQTGFFNMMVTPLGSDLSPVEHLWDVVKLEILIVDTAGKSAAAV